MLDCSDQDVLLADSLRERSQLLRECSISRAAKVLDAKRQRIREELEQLIYHIALLVPLAGDGNSSTEFYCQLLQDAVERLGDRAFAQLLLQVLQDLQH